MQDLVSRLKTLSRPRLLSRAARIGATGYSRHRDLRRILGPVLPVRHGLILVRLLDIEAEQDAARVARNPGYSLVRHVEVLIAIAAESRDYIAASRSGRPTGHAAGAAAPENEIDRHPTTENGAEIDAVTWECFG